MRRVMVPASLVLTLAAPTFGASGKEAAPAPAAGPPVAWVAGVPITSAALEEAVGSQLLRIKTEEYNLRRRILEDLIARALLEKQAAARGLGVDELVRQEVEAKARPVSDEEVKAVYENTRERYTGLAEAEALDQIAAGMKRLRMQQRRAEFLRDLRGQAGVKIVLDPPRVPLAADKGVSRGEASAPLALVEFSDFQCPYCARANGVMKQVEQRYAGKVRVVFRHFPLPSHKEAAKAAEAAGCAGAQGRFWEMHDKLFANQRAQAASDLKRYAAEIGLDAGTFDRCLDSGSYAKVVEEDVAEGRRHGVTGTPTFFVNGRLLSGAAPFEVLALAIDEELERLAVKPAGAPTAGGSRTRSRGAHPR